MTSNNQLSLHDQFEIQKVKTLLDKMSEEQLKDYALSLLTFHLAYRATVIKMIKQDLTGELGDFSHDNT